MLRWPKQTIKPSTGPFDVQLDPMALRRSHTYAAGPASFFLFWCLISHPSASVFIMTLTRVPASCKL